VYDIALSVAACLRAGTRVDVAWVVEAPEPLRSGRAEAVAVTPGGGRVGSLLGGALDGQLGERVGRPGTTGRILDLEISVVDAALAGLAGPGPVRIAVVPATELPPDLWTRLIAREPLGLVSELAGTTIERTKLFTAASIADAGDDAARRFAQGRSTVVVTATSVETVLWPTTKLVVAGAGPIADALGAAAALLGWQVVVAGDPDTAAGLIAGLSALDSVVVMGHEVEPAGRSLAAALASEVGYIGALGSPTMQQTRADWLAFRGITELDRIHGPAGLAIGAKTPAEIALAIVAEAVAVHRGAIA
jgi:xanthine dehydrogenase accessory factor